MSQQNVEVVRQASALTNMGDMEATFRLLHPGIEWVIAKEHPDARTLVGHDALAVYRREWQDQLPDVRSELQRYVDAGDRVVAVGTVQGTGSGSGAELTVPIAFLFTLHDGLITRVQEFLDPAEALAVVGLDA